VEMINHELSIEHNIKRTMKRCLLPWYRYSHEKELARRNEEICRENKIKFDRMMEEAEEAAQLLIRLENERAERERLANEEARRLDREKRLKDAQERVAKQKEEDKKLILSVQKEERQRRVNKATRAMKESFKAVWAEKTDTMLKKARNRITAYVENKENTLAIDMKFDQLKREFFQPPTPENMQREAVLSSVKNIVFLYLQAKLRADLINLPDLVHKFDKGHKGYLTYSEFKEMITSIGANISPAKISSVGICVLVVRGCSGVDVSARSLSLIALKILITWIPLQLQVIRGVDVDGDKCIDIKELELSMKETEQMGTVGSAWR
jgi:hypothetical protein